MPAPSSGSELGHCWGCGPGVDSFPMETKPRKAHEVYPCNRQSTLLPLAVQLAPSYL